MVRRKQTENQANLSQGECQEVAQVAYTLWEQRGRNHGGDQLDWYEAERIVRNRKAEKNNKPRRSWARAAR